VYYLFLLRYFSNISLDLHFYSLIYLLALTIVVFSYCISWAGQRSNWLAL